MAFAIGRRQFISALGGATVAGPLAARAQTVDRARRIGMLLSASQDDPEDQRRRAAFQQSMKQLGWIEGQNIIIEYRWYGGVGERARKMARELVALQPDLIVTAVSPALAATLWPW
jgi:putative ABC transport system substrate-binding protein